jgi:O-antigen/teichoic acid export membrane protein
MNSGKREFRKIVQKEAKEALLYVISNGLIQIGNLVVIPLFWSRLTPDDYGVIAITEIIGSFLSIFLGLSLDQSINKFYYEWSPEERKRGIGAIWVVSWLSCFVIGAASLFILSRTSRYIFETVAFYPYIYLGLIATVLTSLSQITFTTIRIKRLPFFYAWYSLSTFVMYFVLRFIFVFVNREGLTGYYKANIIGAAIAVLCSVVIMLRFSIPCIRNSGLKKSLKFSFPIIPSSILTAFTNICDRLILQSYVSLSELGIYSISVMFASSIIKLHDGIKLSYGPFLWKTVNEEIDCKTIIARMAPFFTAPIFLWAFILSTFIDTIILLINNPSYFAVADLVPPVVGFTLIACLYLYYSPGIMLGDRTDLLWIPSAAKLLLVLSGFVLVPKFGVDGIIFSKYLAAIAFFVISFYLSQRVFPIPYRIKKLMILTVFYISFVSVLFAFSFESYVFFLLVKILASITYLAVIGHILGIKIMGLLKKIFNFIFAN